MNTQPSTPPPGLNLQDILFILRRHKWKIITCALLGFGAAAVFYLRTPVVYESRAKLLVRYVLERSAIDSVDSQSSGSSTRNGDSIIRAEIEILTSLDLANEVSEAIGVDRVSPAEIMRGLSANSRRMSSVIYVAYRNRDPELASAVLQELVNRYFIKHLEVHRSTGAFAFVAQQTDQVRGRLKQTEEDLKKLKADAGISSLADTARINVSMAKCQEELLDAEAALAEQQARVKELEKGLSVADEPGSDGDKPEAALQQVDGGEIQRYQAMVKRLSQLRSLELEVLGKYTDDNPQVSSIQKQIAELNAQREEMEQHFPSLVTTAPTAGNATHLDLLKERAGLAALEAKVEALKSRLGTIRERADRVEEVETEIARLERRRQAEEDKYRYFESSLEKARIDEALDPSKIPNISVLQKPSPSLRVVDEVKKPLLALAGGGLALGVLLAFSIEMVFDRSVKRPVELETGMRVPLFLSIPHISWQPRLGGGSGLLGKSLLGKSLLGKSLLGKSLLGKSLLGNGKSLEKKGARPEVAPWDESHFIRSFAESIRDRLILWFQLKNLTHKPKLVGITGVSGGEGASTLAGGIAASLSETGDGKVLLVDLNSDRSGAHPFFDGKPALGLSEALEANGELPPASENLYLATATSMSGGPKKLPPKQFYALIPSLKASHFDYIIFDLPPVTRSSATLAIAGCLDKLLLVVEAEKSDRDQVKRAHRELTAARADVAAVLNKTREALNS